MTVLMNVLEGKTQKDKERCWRIKYIFAPAIGVAISKSSTKDTTTLQQRQTFNT